MGLTKGLFEPEPLGAPTLLRAFFHGSEVIFLYPVAGEETGVGVEVENPQEVGTLTHVTTT